MLQNQLFKTYRLFKIPLKILIVIAKRIWRTFLFFG